MHLCTVGVSLWKLRVPESKHTPQTPDPYILKIRWYDMVCTYIIHPALFYLAMQPALSLSLPARNRCPPQIWLAKLLFHRPSQTMAPPSLKLFLSIPVLVSSAEILQTPLLTVPSASLALHLGATSLARHPKELLQARRAWNAIREGLDPFGSNVVSKRLQKMLAEVVMSMKPLAAPRVLNLTLTDTTCKIFRERRVLRACFFGWENTAAFASPARLAANKLVYSVPLGRWASCATLQLMRSCHKFGWHNGSVVVLVGQESATWCLWAWVSPPTIWRL